MKKNKVFVIAANWNEEETIGQVLEAIPKDVVDDILVVDGGSKDKSVKVAENLGYKVMQQDGRGRANAFKTGLKHIGSEYDYVVMLSTDGNERPGDIRKIVEKLDEDYDMVIATRFGKGKSKDVTVLRNFGNYFFTVLCNLFTGYKLTDAQNGFRGIRRKAFLDMNIQANRFDIEDEMVMKAGKMKLKVTEIPTIEDEREFGKSRLNTFKDGWLIFKRIINVAFSKPPYR